MIGVAGAVLVLFACTAFVMKRIYVQNKSIEAVGELRRVLSYISEQMKFTKLPLPQLLMQAANEEFGEAKEFLRILTAKLFDGKNRMLGELWNESLDEYSKSINLSLKTVRIMKNIGSRLGTMAQNAEIEALYAADKELESELLKLEAEFYKNSRLLKSSGMLVGILIIILFI